MGSAPPRILLTGRPGVGKTTALLKIIDALRREGYRVGGMVTVEVREHGRRVGFKVIDLTTGQETYLAVVGSGPGPRVGRYVVRVEDFERVGVSALLTALETADVVACDEIGPMELYSEKFKEAVRRAFDSGKPFIGTIHIRADRDPFCRWLKQTYRPKIIEVTERNRNQVPQLVFTEVLQYLRRSSHGGRPRATQ